MSGQTQQSNEGLSNSVSSTPSSSVQPLELPPQEMMSNQMQQDSNIHVQGTSMMAPGDVSMDGSEGMHFYKNQLIGPRIPSDSHVSRSKPTTSSDL
jgi:hypothetical protein